MSSEIYSLLINSSTLEPKSIVVKGVSSPWQFIGWANHTSKRINHPNWVKHGCGQDK